MKGLIVLLALCAYAHAMVPMQRREAVNAEEEDTLRLETTTASEIKLCASQTPCAWSIYKPNTKIVELNITNTYCECSVGSSCQYYEDDASSNSFVFRCQKLEDDRSRDTGPPTPAD